MFILILVFVPSRLLIDALLYIYLDRKRSSDLFLLSSAARNGSSER